jgi:hypothetical protein
VPGCARFPQAVQQPGHVVQVVEGDAGASQGGQVGGLLAGVCFPQGAQQRGQAVWVVEGDGGCGIAGQQDGQLLARARPSQAVQQDALSRAIDLGQR